jgi:hypothetical protein
MTLGHLKWNKGQEEVASSDDVYRRRAVLSSKRIDELLMKHL